jgi:hypothetical protein
MENSLPIYKKGEARELAKQRCRDIGISISTLEELAQAEMNQLGSKNRRNLFIEFDTILDEAE